VGKYETDIFQIRKYLNGELDAKAMHRLERRALDDPFIMDAIEGYASVKGDQQAHLDDLAGRLQQRVEKKQSRIIPLRFISIAASILIICSAGVWWLYREHEPAVLNKKFVAQSVRPVMKPVPPVTDGSASEKRAAESLTVSKAAKPPAKMPEPDKAAINSESAPPILKDITVTKPAADAAGLYPARKDTTPLNELIVTQYTTNKKKDTSLFGLVYKNDKLVKKADTSPVQLLKGRTPGVATYNNDNNNRNKASDISKLMAQGYISSSLGNQLLSNQTITGQVTSKDNGLPIPGAAVKVAGTNNTAITDANGRFEINADSGRSRLVIGNAGYQTRRINANSRDSVQNIALEPDNGSLSEVVVTGYTSKGKDKDAGETAAIPAHPQKGWSSYKKYLKANAVSPDGKTGVVKLSFTVDKYGSITNITVLKGISKATDEKATTLVKDGPEWTGNSGRQPEKVHLRIKFAK